LGSDPISSGADAGLPVVIDTNIVLDLFVFDDPASAVLKKKLQDGQLRWLVTQAMRDELARVLGYTNIVPRLIACQRSADEVLAQFDRHAQLLPGAAKAPVTCSDADDQKFIDLAVVHRAMLLSKDLAVLGMAKRLSALGVRVQTASELAA
jgi:putative PIN family toxin of toxin-antitoxin system